MSSPSVSAGRVPVGVSESAEVCRGVRASSGSSRARQEAAGQRVDERLVVRRVVASIMGVIVGLTFLFGFGNVLHLALRLGVSPWVAPLVAPAVDLSVVALLVGTHHLAASGVDAPVLRPARRLLMFSSVVTLVLNVADPLLAGELGRAAFDAVGPSLLIGWAEVGPGFLRSLSTAGSELIKESRGDSTSEQDRSPEDPSLGASLAQRPADDPGTTKDDLLRRAKVADAEHWAACSRPISAESLRKRLGIGAESARSLVAAIREEYATVFGVRS